MKTDYLWDKTGEDEEIERLENALAAFRYRAAPTNDEAIASLSQSAAVEPRAESFSLKREFSRRIFSYKSALAATACAALMLVAFGVWLQVSSDETNLAVETAANAAPVENASTANESIVETPKQPRFKNSETNAKPAARKTVKRKIATRPQVAAANLARVRKVSPEKSPAKIRFTDEELYAYSQLKLALSIAGSKLKLVKDKAESAEADVADAQDGR